MCSYHQVLAVGHFHSRSSGNNERYEIITLTCQKCGKDGDQRMPHSATDSEVIKVFRGLGWNVKDSGYGAVCPKCVS